jgi:hypothetical protein
VAVVAVVAVQTHRAATAVLVVAEQDNKGHLIQLVILAHLILAAAAAVVTIKLVAPAEQAVLE